MTDYTENAKLFSLRVRKLREDAGITQEELSERTGISSDIVRRAETDPKFFEKNFSVRTLIAYYKFFDVSPKYLLGLQEDKGKLNDS